MHAPMPRALIAGLVYFAAVFAAGVVLGVLRVAWLAGRVGEVWAVAIEVPVMLAIAWLVCASVAARLRVDRRPAARGVMGGSALAFLLLAEAGLSIGVLGRAPGAHLALYTHAPQAIGLAAQLVFAVIPLVQSRLRSARTG